MKVRLRELFAPIFCLVVKLSLVAAKNFENSGLPHCKRSAVVVGEILDQNFDSAQVSVKTNIQLKLTLDETVCFHVYFEQKDNSTKAEPNEELTYNGSLLYTLQYSSLQQHHPVRESYYFGIPELRSHCTCDCPGGDDHCVIGYSYRNCSKGSLCFTTYHPHQSPVGCPHGDETELCCDVAIIPYKDWRFRAVQLGQPDTFAIFTYRLYKRQNGLWSIKSERKLQVPLNKGQTLDLEQEKLSLQVSGSKPHRNLLPGMYFLQKGEAKLRTGVPLNEFREWDLDKLGWFRFANNVWTVRSGWIKFQDAHHANVINCKDQKYSDNYNAEQYVSLSGYPEITATQSYYLGQLATEFEPWMLDSVLLDWNSSRHAIVSHRHSPYLTIDLTIENRPILKFYHHRSKLRDFSGRINLDKYSNRFLNLSFFGAQGTLIGSVYRGEQKMVIDIAFSTYVGNSVASNSTTILALPSTVNSSRWVCFYPSGKPTREQCKWVQYHSSPLSWYVAPHQWSDHQGDCKNCNEMSFNNFLQYLDPTKWFDGISSGSEALAMAFEIIVYIVVILVVLVIVRKCIYPLLKWTVCTGKKPKAKTIMYRVDKDNNVEQ